MRRAAGSLLGGLALALALAVGGAALRAASVCGDSADRREAGIWNNLGNQYATGLTGPIDYAEAALWFRCAAEAGHAAGQNNLAGLYLRGDGVARDIDQAAKWYRRAADQGHRAAQFILGRMHAAGQGAPKDLVAATMWFTLAANEPAPAQITEAAAKFLARLEELLPAADVARGKQMAEAWRPAVEE